MSTEVTEHATRTKGGTMHVRYTSPDIERVYPLAEWLEHMTEDGGKVYRRTIVVVSDWEEVTP